MPDAVVFDLDGVLVDSEHAWDAARRALAAEHDRPWPADATAAMMGMSAPEWSAYVREAVGVPLPAEEIDRRVVEHMLAGYERELPLLPGAVDAVRRLAAEWPLGLASSSNRVVIDHVLAAAGIGACFAATVSSEEVAAGKPAPDVYREAIRRLAVRAEACVAIEDSSNGLRSAAAARLRVIAIPHPGFPPAPDALALAALEIESLDHLTPEAVRRAAGDV